MVNASSLTFSDITVNSIFSLNNTIFSHYTLNEIKGSVINDLNISSIVETTTQNLENISTSNISISNIENNINSINSELLNISTSNVSINDNINTLNDSITTLNTSVSNVETNTVLHNTSISNLNSSLTEIITKTNLIDLSGSTICKFGYNNMSSVYIGNGNTSVYIGGTVYSAGGGTISSLSSPLTISYTPSSITSNTMLGYVISSGNVTVTHNSTQFASTDIDLPTTEPYCAYGINSGNLAGITIPAGVWMVDWLMDVFDSANQLSYDNYLATGIVKASFTGGGGGLHQATAWQLAKQAGIASSFSVYPLTDSNFYIGSYYIGRFIGVNQSSKTGASGTTNYAQFGSRSIISNAFVVSTTSSISLRAFFGMAGQPFTFGNIVFTSKMNATRIA